MILGGLYSRGGVHGTEHRRRRFHAEVGPAGLGGAGQPLHAPSSAWTLKISSPRSVINCRHADRLGPKERGADRPRWGRPAYPPLGSRWINRLRCSTVLIFPPRRDSVKFAFSGTDGGPFDPREGPFGPSNGEPTSVHGQDPSKVCLFVVDC